MVVLPASDEQRLILQRSEDGSAVLRWHREDGGGPELPAATYEELLDQLSRGVRRALSDEFTIVGDIAGRPVLQLAMFVDASCALYLTMEGDSLILQHEDGRVLAEAPLTSEDLGAWRVALG